MCGIGFLQSMHFYLCSMWQELLRKLFSSVYEDWNQAHMWQSSQLVVVVIQKKNVGVRKYWTEEKEKGLVLC